MLWLDAFISTEHRQRQRRHLAGWMLWWLYIAFSIFLTREIPAGSPGVGLYHEQPGLTQSGYLQYCLSVGFKSFLLLVTHLSFCYAIIYIFLPRFLAEKNYWHFLTAVSILCVLMVPVGYFLYAMVYPFVDSLFSISLKNRKEWIFYASIDAGLINAIKLTLVASAIQVLKQWWVREKEKEQLEKEKIRAELQLLKAQIHPAFLFNTLNNIIDHASKASPMAPEMIIKLSDLLSYMLYECDAPKVNLEKEISMLHEYMELEKIRHGERLDMSFHVKGVLNGHVISPLLLLPFVDNGFSYSNNKLLDQAWVNLEISVEGNQFSMKIINGIPAGISLDSDFEERCFADVKKRLLLLYPGRHDLKINAEQELLMVHLNLTLEETTIRDKATIQTTNTVLTYASD